METSNIFFIDTSFFKALIDLNDDFNHQARARWRKLSKKKIQFITTNYILDESFTLIRIKCGLNIVQEFKEILAASRMIKIVRVTINDEAAAWDYFGNDWSSLSFTDCISFTVMKRLKLKQVLSFDRHFQRAGFHCD